MGKRVISFGDFVLLKESANSIETDLPSKWKRLQELGFYDASTPRIKANGNILLKNDKFNYYPEGIILQVSSGQVRDKGARSGYLKKGLNLDQMVDYLIQRFEKLEGSTSAEISPEAATLLRKISKSKATKNPETGRFDFFGSIEMFNEQLDSLKSLGIKLGKIEKDFAYSGYKEGNYRLLTLEDLEYFPIRVGGVFEIRNCRLRGFSDLRSFPTKMGNGLVLNSVENLQSLSGATLNSGKKTEIRINSCQDLTSLGDDLPEEVEGIQITFSGKFSSLKGSPKVVHEDFYVQDTRIKSLEGGPERVGRRYNVASNKFLTSLKGFPLDFDGNFYSSIIYCGKFNLKDRLKIVNTGIYDETEEATPLQREFVATSLPIDYLQSLVDQNPEKMAVVLKGVLKDPYFKGLKWPESLQGEVDLLSDLEDIGL